MTMQESIHQVDTTKNISFKHEESTLYHDDNVDLKNKPYLPNHLTPCFITINSLTA